MTNLIELRQRIGKILLTWSIANIMVGAILFLGLPGSILGGVGLQAIIWGLIDAFIERYVIAKQKEESVEKIASTVRRSIGMDIVFQVVGILVILSFLQDLYMVGNGMGVIIQGFFLLLLDSYYYNALRKLKN
ncbi:MAG: DUF6992 family protein [Candidatus Thorarchaeota archaeon]